MSEVYRATIHGNRIEWDGEVPNALRNNEGADVYVTLVDDSVNSAEPNGKRAAEILKKIADRGGIKSIPDPVAWQREIRKDRPLPGR